MLKPSTRNTQHGRLGPLLAIGLAFLAGGILLGLWVLDRKDDYRAVRMFPQPRDVGEFRLETAGGEAFTRADLAGNWNLLFFGFTNCPDVCPDTLSSLAAVRQELSTKTKSELPRVVFVSVDPERDRGSTMAEYVEWFDESFTAVTADDQALQELTRRLGVVYYRDEPDPGSGYYNVDHSGSVFLIDPDGKLVGRFVPPLNVANVVADLFELTS